MPYLIESFDYVEPKDRILFTNIEAVGNMFYNPEKLMVELPARKPCWMSGMILFSLVLNWNRRRMIFSRTLPMQGRRLIGRWFSVINGSSPCIDCFKWGEFDRQIISIYK